MFLAIHVHMFLILFNIIKASSDALDGLPGQIEGVVEAKSNSTFSKRQL